jgi:hypothetical protein
MLRNKNGHAGILLLGDSLVICFVEAANIVKREQSKSYNNLLIRKIIITLPQLLISLILLLKKNTTLLFCGIINTQNGTLT